MSARGDYGYYPERGPRAPPPGGSTYKEDWQETPPPPPKSSPPPAKRMPDPTRGMINPRVAGMIVLFGVLIFFVGAIILQSATIIKSPDYDDYDDSDDYDKAREDYYDSIRNLSGGGRILNWVGAMIIALPLYIIGISSEEMDWKVRASMLSAGTALVIATMVVTMFVSL